MYGLYIKKEIIKMKKKLVIVFITFITYAMLFAQNTEFNEHMKKAREYESKKKWCFALAEYYDALGTDDSFEIKNEAFEAYNSLATTIKSGNPGFGKFNEFTIHDEWKKLLMDSEIYGSSHSKYELWIGDLQKGDLDYKNKTATYSAKILPTVSYKWLKTIGVIQEGYAKAYKSDWTDLPESRYEEGENWYRYESNWPKESVSSNKDNKFDINGSLVYRINKWYEPVFYNAFEYLGNDLNNYKGIKNSLHDYKFNIIDENGNELVKGKRWLLGTDNNVIKFSGISSDIMDLIDNGKARINLVSEYLEYGLYNSDDDKGGRSFIKNFPEKEIPFEKVLIHYNNIPYEDKAKVYFINQKLSFIDYDPINLIVSDDSISYDLAEIVMGGNEVPDENRYYSFSKGENAIADLIFVNRLSQIMGFVPVYSIKDYNNLKIRYEVNNTCYYDWDGWFYMNNIEINENNNGFRLATKDETEKLLSDNSLKFTKHMENLKNNLPYNWSDWSIQKTVEYYITSYHDLIINTKDGESVPGGSYQFLVVRKKE